MMENFILECIIIDSGTDQTQSVHLPIHLIECLEFVFGYSDI